MVMVWFVRLMLWLWSLFATCWVDEIRVDSVWRIQRFWANFGFFGELCVSQSL